LTHLQAVRTPPAAAAPVIPKAGNTAGGKKNQSVTYTIIGVNAAASGAMSVSAHTAPMNSRHLLRVASITSVAFLADGKGERVEQRKAAGQPRRWEAKRRPSSRTPVSDRFRFAA
jgi:hypothetical protein